MATNVTLRITIPDSDEQEVAALTREMMRSIEKNTDEDVRLPEGVAPSGSKGDAALMGQLLVTFLTSGAAVALIDVFKPYFARRPKLEIEFSTKGGNLFKLKAEDIAPKALSETVSRLRSAVVETA